MKVIAGVYSGVTTVELDTLAAETAAAMTTKHPDYAILAARIAVSNLHKETQKLFSGMSVYRIFLHVATVFSTSCPPPHSPTFMCICTCSRHGEIVQIRPPHHQETLPYDIRSHVQHYHEECRCKLPSSPGPGKNILALYLVVSDFFSSVSTQPSSTTGTSTTPTLDLRL